MKYCLLFPILAFFAVTSISEHKAEAQMEYWNTPKQVVRNCDATAADLVRLINDRLTGAGSAILGVAQPDAPYKIPDGSWEVFYRPQQSAIVVRRVEPVQILFSSHGINGPGGEPKKLTSYNPGFALIIGKLVSLDEYHRSATENVAIREQLSQMRTTQMRNIDHKFDQYLPRTVEERKLVDAYNHLKSSLHSRLPNFYFHDISLFWSDTEYQYLPAIPQSPDFLRYSQDQQEHLEDWQRERAEVGKMVIQLLSSYTP